MGEEETREGSEGCQGLGNQLTAELSANVRNPKNEQKWSEKSQMCNSAAFLCPLKERSAN